MREIETPSGVIAVHESPGGGPATVLIHGNSSSSHIFSRQLEGALGAKRRLVAIDLPGHGDSDNAEDISVYGLRGYARALAHVIAQLHLADAVFAGWSLGGHIVLEMAPSLPRARGFVIFGTPPLAFPPDMEHAFLPNPAVNVGFTEKVDRAQAEAYATAGFRPGVQDIPTFIVDNILRTDGRARAGLAASIAPNAYHDEIAVVANLKAPLAVLHGAEEQLVNGAYFDSLVMPTLWRGGVQVIANAGHTPQWENADAFDALLDAFVGEVA